MKTTGGWTTRLFEECSKMKSCILLKVKVSGKEKMTGEEGQLDKIFTLKRKKVSN
jgi:hypothetical protein